jgi:protein-S-isoprenylcysteine O-methyltransferase Ste14
MHDMAVYRWIIFACWLVMIIVWTVTAFGAKPSLNRRRYWTLQGGVHLAILIAVLLGLRFTGVRHALGQPGFTVHDPHTGLVGAALVVLGVGLAVWARFVIGRNWGNPMAQKENPELVTAGPYAVIRHPIYTGILTAMLGSTIALRPGLFLFFPLLAVYFIYSARQEEERMALLFPAQYPAYKARTKMLLPFIL